MLKRMKLMSLLASVMMVLAIAPSVWAQYTPAVVTSDQDVVDGTVTVKMASANGPSWVVIHADDNGAPGPVLGQTAVEAGVAKDVLITIDTEGLTDTLHAMLHDDLGEVGTYEFPGADVPTQVGGKIVMKPFQVTGEASSIVGVAKGAGNFTTLLAAVEAAGLTSTLMQEGPLTVFAPTDEAFAKIPQDQLDALLADVDALIKVLTYHVVPGGIKSTDLADGMTATTVEGEDVTISISGDTVMVNDATVTTADLEAANGVIHVIDTVIMPPSMAAASEAMTETTEMAASEAMTETSEVAASGTTTETAPVEDAGDGGMDIVDTAVAGEFNTLVTAVTAAGLVDALKGEGPFTVFAPTNEAFAKIPSETLNALLADPKGDLTQILLYHVVPGKVLSTDITDGMEVETLQGTKVKFTVGDDGSVMINDAKIIAVDIPATNGVIHVIDTVIMPAADEAAPVADPAADTTTAAPEAAAPEAMPATGGATDTLLTLLIVAGVLAGLVGSTILSRRRTA